MFQKAKNIDTAFRQTKGICLIVILFCFSVLSLVLFKSYELAAKLENKVYVLAGDKAIEAFASVRKDNIMVEAKDHIRMFHTWFFTIDPDEKTIYDNVSKALYLADNTAKKQYDNLKETGFYAGIIAGNISQEISIDSILVDIRKEPFVFRCFATIKITRPTSSVTRSLVTQGYLRKISRSDHNSHGFLIEKWETLENKDIKSEAR